MITVEVRNRFKGLDLIDRVPDDLWTEVRDIVQETQVQSLGREGPWRRKWQPTPIFLSGESHGQRAWVASMGSQRIRHD